MRPVSIITHPQASNKVWPGVNLVGLLQRRSRQFAPQTKLWRLFGDWKGILLLEYHPKFVSIHSSHLWDDAESIINHCSLQAPGGMRRGHRLSALQCQATYSAPNQGPTCTFCFGNFFGRPAYSLNLASSDFFLFSQLRNHLVDTWTPVHHWCVSQKHCQFILPSTTTWVSRSRHAWSCQMLFYLFVSLWNLCWEIQGLPLKWCSLSPDGLVTPSIRILMKHTFCSSLSFKQTPWISICQINLKLLLTLWKQLFVPVQRMRGAKRSKLKKWEECPMFGSIGSVRGKVFASFAILKKVHS